MPQDYVDENGGLVVLDDGVVQASRLSGQFSLTFPLQGDRHANRQERQPFLPFRDDGQ